MFSEKKNSQVNILPESLQKPSLNLWTSQDRFSSQNVTVAVGFGLLVAALFGLGSAEDAKCVGKKDGLASSSEKQEERASTTPTKKANVMRDACSGLFSSLKRAEKEKPKATQLQEIKNTRVEKAKRMLIMDPEEESLPNKVTRSSLRLNTVDDDFPSCSRLVDLEEMKKGLERCTNCQQGPLPLSQIYGERNFGLASTLTVNCPFCGAENKLSTSKSHSSGHRGPQAFDINTRAALGALHAGIGHTHLTALTSTLNIPSISHVSFKKREREIGCATETLPELLKVF